MTQEREDSVFAKKYFEETIFGYVFSDFLQRLEKTWAVIPI